MGKKKKKKERVPYLVLLEWKLGQNPNLVAFYSCPGNEQLEKVLLLILQVHCHLESRPFQKADTVRRRALLTLLSAHTWFC